MDTRERSVRIFNEFKLLMGRATSNNEDVLRRMQQYYEEANPHFLWSPDFIDFIGEYSQKIVTSSDKDAHIQQFLVVLSGYKMHQPLKHLISQCSDSSAGTSSASYQKRKHSANLSSGPSVAKYSRTNSGRSSPTPPFASVHGKDLVEPNQAVENTNGDNSSKTSSSKTVTGNGLKRTKVLYYKNKISPGNPSKCVNGTNTESDNQSSSGDVSTITNGERGKSNNNGLAATGELPSTSGLSKAGLFARRNYTKKRSFESKSAPSCSKAAPKSRISIVPRKKATFYSIGGDGQKVEAVRSFALPSDMKIAAIAKKAHDQTLLERRRSAQLTRTDVVDVICLDDDDDETTGNTGNHTAEQATNADVQPNGSGDSNVVESEQVAVSNVAGGVNSEKDELRMNGDDTVVKVAASSKRAETDSSILIVEDEGDVEGGTTQPVMAATAPEPTVKDSTNADSSSCTQDETGTKPSVENTSLEQPSTEPEAGPSKPLKGSSSQVRRLELLLKKLDVKIKELAEADQSLEEMDDGNSSYILEEQYKKKFVLVWNKLCELTSRPVTTGRISEQKFKFNTCRYKEINHKICKLINRHHVFPDFQDIGDIIVNCNKQYDFKLGQKMIDDMTRSLFVDVGSQLQKRRVKDYQENFGCHVTDRVNFV